MPPPDEDRESVTRARIEALELVAAQLEAGPVEVDVQDPNAVLFELSKLAAVFLARSFDAVSGRATSARAWIEWATNQEIAQLAEMSGGQRP